jgi:hypothetical protein
MDAQNRPDRVALRDYVDTLVKSLREYVDTRFAAVNEAVSKADSQLRTRFDATNEWRAAMEDRERRFATGESVSLQVQRLSEAVLKLEERLMSLEKAHANAEGRSWMLMTLLGVFLTLLSIGLRFLL